MGEPKWLDDGEMAAWRAYRVTSIVLEGQLHRELVAEHGISLADYEVLVRLAEQPGRRMRMSRLAVEVASSKSRVSHQIARMERARLVERDTCSSDGRGVYAVLTEFGMDTLRKAAPTHVDGVRRHMVDLLDEQEQTVLAKVFTRIGTMLGETPED